MRSGFICRSGAIAGRMACILAAALLACASSAHSQVIEEGGFPVKAGGVWGEPFSLSCPPRLVAQAGESVAISCTVASVPEEGVRYEWESLSGDGLRLLSDANERSPLFTVPVSGEGAEYAYRLTAMSVGVYETATVTVSVEVVSGGSVQDRGKSPGLPDRCDSFGALEGFGEGCVGEDKAPGAFESFEDGFEGEEGPGLFFPEAPGLPDRPSGPVRDGGPARQTPPRLDCPVAVFLEELETGQIECHAWDASGEEYLEYSWEPVGNTTRDYLDNPRLMPEDAPNPSVVAPEAPAYETLESFRSGDRAFRYRYRLTVTSRATGLSSSSEVEVYVSSSRPSVYCPLEIVVEEGETITLDCEGVDPLSARMDYDEEAASVLWEWEGLWGTDTAPLDATDLSSPLFTAPVGSAGKQYHYIASMTSQASGVPRMARRRVSVVVMDGKEAVDDTVVGVASTAPDSRTEAVVDRDVRCSGTGGVETNAIWAQGFLLQIDFYVDEGDPDFTIQCEISGSVLSLGPITWSWTGSADAIDLLEATDTSNPVVHVPDDVDQDTKYEYIVTAERGTSGSEIVIDFDPVSVTVRDKSLPLPSLVVNCDGDTHSVDEGSGNLFFECTASGVPDSSTAVWSWSPTTLLTRYDSDAPIFAVPKDVERDTTYTYTATVTAENAEAGSGTVKITVRDKSLPSPSLTCTNSEVYEATVDFTLSCWVANEPSGATYAWAVRGSTSDTDDLSSTTILKPTFFVPSDINESEGADKDYEYTVTLSAGGADVTSADITVTVLEKPDIGGCPATSSITIWEGVVETMITCQLWSGAPGVNPVYTYRWTPRGGTTDTQRLSDSDEKLAEFHAPEEVDDGETEIYEYRLTVSAANADNGTEDYTVIVNDQPNITLTCADSPYEVHEGDADIELECEAYGRWDSTTFTPQGTWYTWQWLPRTNLTGDTDIIPGDKENDTSTPTFAVPDNVDRDTTYTYTVTATSANSEDGTAEVTVTVRDTDSADPSLTCTDSEVYEATTDFTLSCSVANEPSGATYAWAARGSTSDTDDLSSMTILKPTFDVPDDIDESGGADKDYEYTVTLSASGIDGITADVTVTVLEKPDIVCVAAHITASEFRVPEGYGHLEIASCSEGWTGAPSGSVYAYVWTARGDTPDTALLVSGTNDPSPTFSVPSSVNGAETYEYRLTVSAENADPAVVDYKITVHDGIAVICVSPDPIYEGSDALTLSCTEENKPPGATYAWTGTDVDNRLTDTDGLTPTFTPPDNVDADTDYDYTVTMMSGGSEVASADVTVTVLNTPPSIACTATPDRVYEGSADDITVSCSAQNTPSVPFIYAWGGSDDFVNLLKGWNGDWPIFGAPDNVNGDTEYVFTVNIYIGQNGCQPDLPSCALVSVADADVTITVLEKPDIAVTCPGNPYAVDESDSLALNCTASGAPDVNSKYMWSWSPVDRLTNHDTGAPVFSAPADVDQDTTWTYRVTATADNADDGTAEVTVTVLDRYSTVPSLTCNDSEVYEATADFTLSCSVTDEPTGATYAWTGTDIANRLSSMTILNPAFDVPDNVDAHTDYDYTVTLSASGIVDVTEDVTVRVLNKPSLALVCTPPAPVYEGAADFDLDCAASGAPAGSVYTYAWTARGDTPDLSLLTGTSSPAPTFSVPSSVNGNETYEYWLTVSAANAEDATADVTVTVLNKRPLSVACASPPLAYEGSADFALACTASGAPAGSVYAYAWTPRGSTTDTSLLTDTNSPAPTFSVPSNVDADETYEYRLTVSAANADDATADVTVTVLNKKALSVVCVDLFPEAYEGSASFALDCSASGAPVGSVYAYAWTPRGSTTDTSLLTDTNSPAPTFSVPSNVDADETYEYRLTVSAANADDATADVTVTVLNKKALSVVCVDLFPEAYEGSASFALDCSASGAPVGSVYAYAWTPRGSTTDTSLLTDTNSPAPTFSVPSNVDADETYEYRLTVSAANADDATADVTVTVLNKKALSVVCADPGSVYEGSAAFDLDCVASGAPVGSVYSYVWSARGDASDLSLLTGTSGPAPTFSVPLSVNSHETYEYTLTVSAANAEDATADVTVTVLDKGALAVACASPPLVYEGSAPFDLNCSASGAPGANPVYSYVWSARGDTPDLSLLTGTSGPAPTFSVPSSVNGNETYEYTLTVSAANAEDATADITVTVLDKGALSVACAPPPLVYEGSAPFDLNCSASGAPGANPVYSYVWSARGDTPDTALLTGTSGPAPTFSVPLSVNSNETYEYTLTVSAANAEDATADVTVTVLDKGALAVACASPPLVYEGSAPFDLNCSASGAPGANPVYSYVWSARGDTPDLSLLTGTSGPAPTFSVPSSVNGNETYEYTLTVSAANAEDATADVTVTVLDKGALSVACAPPPLVYEGSAPFDLDCSASGAPGANPVYSYVWSARGDTPDLSLLTGTSSPMPTFSVPSSVNGNETYEYTLTVSAANAADATADVTVTVLDKGALSVACASPPLAYEGSAPFDLNCAASGAPGANPVYSYVWTARGDTPDTALLSAVDIASPTFYVPDEVDGTTAYEYLLTASAENAEDGSAAVTVTVLNAGALHMVCTDPPSVYEGSEDFDLDCTASGAPAGSEYAYVWTARGTTANTDLLISGTDSPTPTFAVPDAVDRATTYEYLLTVSAENAENATAEVTVTVLNAGALHVVCTDPPSVYEGSADFDLDCTVSGAPSGSDYEYVWTARGSTANTDLLTSGTDGPTPTFDVPDEVDRATTYEYLLTASAENAEDATAEVTVTVLNAGALHVVCTDPPSVYEGSEDFDLDCSASGAPAGSAYEYAWTARGSTPNTDLLTSGTDGPTPTFDVPDEIDETTTYEYLLTVSAENAEDGVAEVTITVLNRGVLSVVCADPPSVYEGSEDFALDCSASGAPEGSGYAYVWTARGDTQDTSLLSAVDVASPTFHVPDEVDETTTYEYLLTASAENAENATAEVTVTVLNRRVLSVVCADPPSAYEGSEDFALDCSASGAPAGSEYAYVWTAQGDTENTDLLISGTDGPTPTFAVPDEVEGDETYEYTLTVSAENAGNASAEVTVTVLDRSPLALDDAIAGRVYVFTVGETIADILLPGATGGLPPYTYTLEPVLPRGLRLKVDGDPTRTISGTPLEVSPRSEYIWQAADANTETVQIAFFIEVAPAEEPTSPPVAESSSELPEPSALGVTVSASSLRFGLQSTDTEVSLDPMTDGISTYVSGPYHAGRMTLSSGGGEALDENGEMDLSIELASPVVLKRADAIDASLIDLTPSWSYSESCDQLSSQAIGGLYTEVTLSDADCRLLRFGGELDLTDALSGQYTGSLDLILRSGESEETFAVEVSVTVVPARRVITIGPGGVRFSTSREVPAGLAEEQNLSIYPDVAFLTEGQSNGVFELSNPSLIPLEVSVSARFGYTEATENGREVVIEDTLDSRLGDLSEVVDIHPGVLVLMPGEKGLIRYGVKEGALAAMTEKGYAAFFDVVSEPRLYVRLDQMPEEVTGDRTARVTMRVPGVYVPGEGASQLRATLLSVSFVGSMSATFLLETTDRPFAGEVVAYDGDGRELGRRETLVYTRSRVRVPLDRIPEEGAVFLRFAPRGSGRVPEPASVDWYAPRRDIGDAGDKDRTSAPATLVQKP